MFGELGGMEEQQAEGLLRVMAPVIVLVLAALALMVLHPAKVLLGKEDKPYAHYLSLLALLVGIFLIVGASYLNYSMLQPLILTFSSMLMPDRFTTMVTLLLLFVSYAVLELSATKIKELADDKINDYYALFLLSIAAAIVLLSSRHLLLTFVSLETLSFAVYGLCAKCNQGADSRLSTESAIKYFIIGSTASAFFLLGVALLYGVAGDLSFAVISSQLSQSGSGFLSTLALSVIVLAMSFKLALAPFHLWIADVYQGAPLPTVLYMATIQKIVLVAMIANLLLAVLSSEVIFWAPLVSLLAGLSIVIGTLLAFRGKPLTRFVAYGGIAHCGFMLLAVLSIKDPFGYQRALSLYLLVYSFASLLLLAFPLLLSKEDEHQDSLLLFKGLYFRNAFLGASTVFALLVLAGLPPGLAGLWAKISVFKIALAGEFYWLVVVAALMTAVSFFYYGKIIGYIFCKTVEASGAIAVSFSQRTIIALIVFLLVVVSFMPQMFFFLMS